MCWDGDGGKGAEEAEEAELGSVWDGDLRLSVVLLTLLFRLLALPVELFSAVLVGGAPKMFDAF